MRASLSLRQGRDRPRAISEGSGAAAVCTRPVAQAHALMLSRAPANEGCCDRFADFCMNAPVVPGKQSPAYAIAFLRIAPVISHGNGVVCVLLCALSEEYQKILAERTAELAAKETALEEIAHGRGVWRFRHACQLSVCTWFVSRWSSASSISAWQLSTWPRPLFCRCPCGGKEGTSSRRIHAAHIIHRVCTLAIRGLWLDRSVGAPSFCGGGARIGSGGEGWGGRIRALLFSERICWRSCRPLGVAYVCFMASHAVTPPLSM